VKDIISQYIVKTDKILNVGAGNSRLSEEMYDEGYQNICNIDISLSIVKFMEDKLKTKCPNITCNLNLYIITFYFIIFIFFIIMYNIR
jgi:2-polyprenyl-3-methyl-5-hydroxy-6-metoxy-1,4-benzoquinol methylase